MYKTWEPTESWHTPISICSDVSNLWKNWQCFCSTKQSVSHLTLLYLTGLYCNGFSYNTFTPSCFQSVTCPYMHVELFFPPHLYDWELFHISCETCKQCQLVSNHITTMFNLLRIFTFYVKAFYSSQNKFHKQYVDLSEQRRRPILTHLYCFRIGYWAVDKLFLACHWLCPALAGGRLPEVYLLVSFMRLAILLKETKTSIDSIHHLQDTT